MPQITPRGLFEQVLLELRRGQPAHAHIYATEARRRGWDDTYRQCMEAIHG